jgi:hypothetical protein
MELDLDGSDRLQIPREMYTEAKFSLTLVPTIVTLFSLCSVENRQVPPSTLFINHLIERSSTQQTLLAECSSLN